MLPIITPEKMIVDKYIILFLSRSTMNTKTLTLIFIGAVIFLILSAIGSVIIVNATSKTNYDLLLQQLSLEHDQITDQDEENRVRKEEIVCDAIRIRINACHETRLPKYCDEAAYAIEDFPNVYEAYYDEMCLWSEMPESEEIGARGYDF